MLYVLIELFIHLVILTCVVANLTYRNDKDICIILKNLVAFFKNKNSKLN
jgi:hypothetical protein